MSEPQREDLLQQVERLEREKRRWKGLALTMSALLAVLLCGAVTFGMVAQLKALRARELALEAMHQAEAERHRALEEHERAEQAREEAERQRDQAEKARRDAEKAKEAEKKARQEARRRLYLEQIHLAEQAWQQEAAGRERK